MGTLIPHEVLTSQFAQAHPFSFRQFMGRGYDEYEGFAMHCDNIEGRVPTCWHTKKSNVERPGLQHPYLLRRDNIAQRKLYFGIQFSKLTNDIGHNLPSRSRDEANPQYSQFPIGSQP